jgi:hypothetical protein
MSKKNHGRAWALALGIGTVVTLATGVAYAQNFGGGAVVERYFKVEFEPIQTASGGTIIRGHVSNAFSRGARNVRLLVEGLDSGNRPVSKTFGYVNGDVAAAGRRYFEVAAPTPGTTFRISVLSFDWLPDGGGR